jgi:hypothetical protein
LLPDGLLDQLPSVVDVGLNYTMAAALTADGRVIEFRPGDQENQPPGLTNVIAFDIAGQDDDDDLDYRVALTRDSRLVVWVRFGPVLVAEVPGLVAIAGGWNHVVGLKGDGTVVQWDFADDPEPVVVSGLSNVVAVAAGGEHSVALKSDGTVTAWGANFYGQLDVPEGLSYVVAITASEYHTLVLKSDGTLAGWGRGDTGESFTVPTSLSNVIAIATSGPMSLALVGLPPQPPVLNLVADASNAGRLILSLTGDPNRIYTIESSEELQMWQFDRFLTNETGTVTFEVDPSAGSRRFYKATTP